MTDAQEIAAAMAELVSEDSIIVTDTRSATFAARKTYATPDAQSMQDAGYLQDQDLQILVPAANVPGTAFAVREKMTIDSVVYRISEIERGASVWLVSLSFANENE